MNSSLLKSIWCPTWQCKFNFETSFQVWFGTVYKLKVPPMESVIMKFFIASLFMWITPIALLYGFNHNLIPGSTQLDPRSLTLLSGFLAIISVNVVIAIYIIVAIKESSGKHEPDPAFLAQAKASINQSTGKADDPSQAYNKKEE